ncbi:MAG: molybdate ABC transporter substrate-binding protein [Usitatibacter sp.]
MRRLFALAAFLLVAGAARADDIVVFAASSLKEALNAVVHAYEANGKDHVIVSYAGSNDLGRQIENGAPADVFISADKEWIDYVVQRNLVLRGSRTKLLANDLVLIAPAASKVQLKLAPGVNIAGALGNGRIALADPDTVPSGKYGKAAFTSLGAWSAIEGKVTATDSVRAALALVSRGEAPLGVVYSTDAFLDKRVRIVDTFPANTHPPVEYRMARLKRGTSPSVTALQTYLASPEALIIFKQFGFRAP